MDPEPPVPGEATRSVTLSGDPAYFALPPISRVPVTRSVAVRSYVSGGSDPLPGPGVPQTFGAVDAQAWVTAVLGLIERALAPAVVDAATGREDAAAPLARLTAAKRALSSAIAAGAAHVVPGDGGLGAVASAFERALDADLTAGWAATGVVQLPMTVDATFEDGGTHRLAVVPRAPSAEAGLPAVVSPGVLGLDDERGTLDLVVAVADPQRRRRLAFDLELEAGEIEHVVDPVPVPDPGPDPDPDPDPDPAPDPEPEPAPAPPPVTSDGSPTDGLGPWPVALDLPGPIRVLPEPPGIEAVEAVASTAVDDAARTVAAAATWTLRMTFATTNVAQDELWLRIVWNAASADAPGKTAEPAAGEADGPTGPRSNSADPFVALAELIRNDRAIRVDLDRFVAAAAAPEPPDPDPDAWPRALGALTALAELTEQLAASWGPIAVSGAVADPHPAIGSGSTATLRLETVNGTGDDSGTVREFVLRRAAGTAWGPEDRRPQLGYRDDDAGLVVLEPTAADGDENVLRYVPDAARPVPPDERRTVALGYAGLRAVQTQSASGAAWVVRNAALVPDRETASAFVMRTSETRAAPPVVPSVLADEPIVIGRGPLTGFGAALRGTLATVTVPGRTCQSLAVRYAERVATGQEGSDPGIDVLVPVVLVPTFDDASAVPQRLAEQVTAWFAAHGPELAGVGHLSLELRVFADAAPAGAPLLTLSRLEYHLTS